MIESSERFPFIEVKVFFFFLKKKEKKKITHAREKKFLIFDSLFAQYLSKYIIFGNFFFNFKMCYKKLKTIFLI